MAAPCRLHLTLHATSRVLLGSMYNDAVCFPRALPQLQFVRGRRRTCRPKAWWVPKKEGLQVAKKMEMTPANLGFIKEVAEDRYKEMLTSPLKEQPWPRNPYGERTLRTGALAVKIGVMPQWTTYGKKFFVTILQVLDNHVIGYTPPDEFKVSDGYNKKWKGTYGSVVVGALSADPFNYTKAYNNLFKTAGVPPKRKLTRFLVTPDAAVQPGTPIHATHYKVGDFVDVQAKTIGHGFQGVVKRWGMKGGPASHGTTKWHRRPGTISSGRTMSRVVKGKKMPGHMGMEWRTLRGLKIFRINTKYNLLFVKGPCLPGPNHCYMRIMDTKLHYRRQKMEELPMPTWYAEDEQEPLPEELFDEEMFEFSQPSITFEESTVVQKKGARG